MNETGYSHLTYAQSLGEFGKLLELPTSKGWIIKRSIPKTSEFDAMGCYPIFACQDWSKLGKDLSRVGDQLVSLSLITDPFGKYTPQDLKHYFKDIARPYKEHFIVDLRKKPDDFVSRHHQRNVRKGLSKIEVEVCVKPIRFLDEWVSLYNGLIIRHAVTGMTKFSRNAFFKQLNTPGIVAFLARSNSKIVGMLLWYIQNNVGYYHLGAYSVEGYQQQASFALFWKSIEYFSDTGVNSLSLGAGAGTRGKDDGLTRFKSGWATGTRTAYFCGRIFDKSKYKTLSAMYNKQNTDYFPAYRVGEFA